MRLTIRVSHLRAGDSLPASNDVVVTTGPHANASKRTIATRNLADTEQSVRWHVWSKSTTITVERAEFGQ